MDVLPYLTTSDALKRHIEEYFAGDGAADIPAVLKWGAEKSGMFGGLAAAVMGKAIRANIEGMAKGFIIGRTAKEAVKSIKKLRRDGFAFTVDLLGEATMSEAEADAYRDGYLEVLSAIEREQASWPALGGARGNWTGATPPGQRVHQALGLFSQAKPVDMEGSIAGILSRLVPVYRATRAMGGALCIDMEAVKYKDMTLELFKRLRTDPEFRDYPHLSVVLQAYLKDTGRDLADLLAFARAENLPIGIRLVKGAYWDFETVVAKQMGWEVPVWTKKPETDAAFERLSTEILRHCDLVYYQCASHNIRTISQVMETAGPWACPRTAMNSRPCSAWPSPCARGFWPWPGGCGCTAPTASFCRAWPIWCAGCSKTRPTSRFCARVLPTAKPRTCFWKTPGPP